MDRIAIFAALQWECAPVLRLLRQVTRDRLGTTPVWHSELPTVEVWLAKTGIGPERAEAAACDVIAPGRFDLIVSTGCAGALASAFQPGDLVIATTVVATASGHRYGTDNGYRARLGHAAEKAALPVSFGSVLSSAGVLATAAAKHAAAAAHGAVAVEMEGAPIAARAAQLGVPFVSVRAILDTATTEIRHAGRFVDPHSGNVKPLKLAGYLAAHPSALPDLLAIQRMVRAAQTSLEQLFSAWLTAAPCRRARGET